MTANITTIIPASEVARWYPYAVVRTLESGQRYVHSVHETLREAIRERDRIGALIGSAFAVMLVDSGE